jgi:glycosyltransferase involved in cell wall biosynthesis
MDVFVCPSMQENLPNTIGEAMACGVPCAGFAVGGIPELIEPGRTGALARPFDAGELAAGIRDCIANTREWGAQARRFVEARLAAAPVAAAYLQAYEDALRGG